MSTETTERLCLLPQTARAIWREHTVALTAREFKIVQLLVGKAGERVSYRQIYDQIRGVGFQAGAGPEGFRANVRTFVKRIRQKFRAADPDFDMIGNHAGIGYWWKGGIGA